MRKVILHMNMSLDGVVSDVEKWADINSSAMDESIERYTKLDTVIFGGATFPGMAEYWQKAEKSSKSAKAKKLAKALGEKQKIALTNRPMEVDWNNSEAMIAKNDQELVKKINGLKEGRGKPIVVESGTRTWRKFLRTNLFDELHIVVNPVIAGVGDKLFEGPLDKTKLQLAKEKKLKGGLIKLEYRKA